MRAVDTNLLVRLLARDAPRQAAAADAFIGSGAWVSQLVLVETLWVLGSVYDLGPGEIASAVELLLDHEALTVQDADVVAAALTLLRKKPHLGFSDCLVLEAARKAGHIPLGTFDRELGKLDGVELL